MEHSMNKCVPRFTSSQTKRRTRGRKVAHEVNSAGTKMRRMFDEQRYTKRGR